MSAYATDLKGSMRDTAVCANVANRPCKPATDAIAVRRLSRIAEFPHSLNVGVIIEISRCRNNLSRVNIPLCVRKSIMIVGVISLNNVRVFHFWCAFSCRTSFSRLFALLLFSTPRHQITAASTSNGVRPWHEYVLQSTLKMTLLQAL